MLDISIQHFSSRYSNINNCTWLSRFNISTITLVGPKRPYPRARFQAYSLHTRGFLVLSVHVYTGIRFGFDLDKWHLPPFRVFLWNVAPSRVQWGSGVCSSFPLCCHFELPKGFVFSLWDLLTAHPGCLLQGSSDDDFVLPPRHHFGNLLG